MFAILSTNRLNKTDVGLFDCVNTQNTSRLSVLYYIFICFQNTKLYLKVTRLQSDSYER